MSAEKEPLVYSNDRGTYIAAYEDADSTYGEDILAYVYEFKATGYGKSAEEALSNMRKAIDAIPKALP